MPWSDDHQAITETIGAWRSGHSPDGRSKAGRLDLPPDLFGRMMRGEITSHEANREWAEREPGQRSFNDRLRREARGGYVADASEVLAPDSEGTPTVRDAQTGRYADIEQAAHDAGHKTIPGGIVPAAAARPVDPNAGIRRAYEAVVRARAERS